VDTRTKILTPAAVASLDLPRPVLLATGRFDILRVELARGLAAARERSGARSLVAVVQPIEGEYAPLDARAEMAAALRMVDYVVIAQDGDVASLAASLQPVEMIHLEGAEAQRARQLIEHVRRRLSS
jgi:bifunctional ADP-heptose synthase (sugar kinase/adenylyltransferase)